MTIDKLLISLQSKPNTIEFDNCIETIDSNYNFTPTAFQNGNQYNDQGKNNGSCKIFAFGLLHKLTQQQTLACFGDYYRNDVLKKPDADDHQNIRQFMQHGWEGIKFSGQALHPN